MSDEAEVLALEGLEPRIAADAWLAPGVVVVGDVRIESGANLWFGTVARGDVEPLEIGEGSNVQDGCVLHADPDQPLVIGADVSIGHRAVVHGCRVGDGALIGMGSVVMSGAEIGVSAVIGAGAVVVEGTTIPAGAVAVGVPAKVVGESSGTEGRAAAERYRERAMLYRDSGVGR